MEIVASSVPEEFWVDVNHQYGMSVESFVVIDDSPNKVLVAFKGGQRSNAQPYLETVSTMFKYTYTPGSSSVARGSIGTFRLPDPYRITQQSGALRVPGTDRVLINWSSTDNTVSYTPVSTIPWPYGPTGVAILGPGDSVTQTAVSEADWNARQNLNLGYYGRGIPQVYPLSSTLGVVFETGSYILGNQYDYYGQNLSGFTPVTIGSGNSITFGTTVYIPEWLSTGPPDGEQQPENFSGPHLRLNLAHRISDTKILVVATRYPESIYYNPQTGFQYNPDLPLRFMVLDVSTAQITASRNWTLKGMGIYSNTIRLVKRNGVDYISAYHNTGASITLFQVLSSGLPDFDNPVIEDFVNFGNGNWPLPLTGPLENLTFGGLYSGFNTLSLEGHQILADPWRPNDEGWKIANGLGSINSVQTTDGGVLAVHSVFKGVSSNKESMEIYRSFDWQPQLQAIVVKPESEPRINPPLTVDYDSRPYFVMKRNILMDILDTEDWTAYENELGNGLSTFDFFSNWAGGPGVTGGAGNENSYPGRNYVTNSTDAAGYITPTANNTITSMDLHVDDWDDGVWYWEDMGWTHAKFSGWWKRSASDLQLTVSWDQHSPDSNYDPIEHEIASDPTTVTAGPVGQWQYFEFEFAPRDYSTGDGTLDEHYGILSPRFTVTTPTNRLLQTSDLVLLDDIFLDLVGYSYDYRTYAVTARWLKINEPHEQFLFGNADLTPYHVTLNGTMIGNRVRSSKVVKADEEVLLTLMPLGFGTSYDGTRFYWEDEISLRDVGLRSDDPRWCKITDLGDTGGGKVFELRWEWDYSAFAQKESVANFDYEDMIIKMVFPRLTSNLDDRKVHFK